MKLLAKIDKRLAELDAMLDGSGDRICWQPIPNSPQEQAYYSPADELLFGGQAGGGKSMVIIGLALTAHKRSLILRKRESDLSSVVAAVQELTQCPGSKSIKFQNRQLYFGGCKDDSSKYKWKGQDHDLKCLEAGTPVLMATGEYKAIEKIKVGDKVQTLEGARVVTRTIRQRKPAVRLSVFLNGDLIASQVQGRSHEVMTAHTLSASPYMSSEDYPAFFSSPIQRHGICRYSESNYHKFQSFQKFPEYQCLGQGQPLALLEGNRDLQFLQGSFFDKGDKGQGNGFLEKRGGYQEHEPHPLLSQPSLKRLLQLHEKELFLASHQLFSRELPYAHGHSLLANLKDHCLRDSRQYDEQPHLSSAIVLLDLHQSDGAEQHIPKCLTEDARGNTHTHSRYKWSYVHPYTKEIRQSVREAHAYRSYEVQEVGDKTLFDLTVKDTNHYITKGGFINRNCFDELSEFKQEDYEFISAWNRTSEPGQRCRIVATTNPPDTNEGRWIIERWAPWLDPSHPNPAQSGELRWYLGNKEVGGPDPIDGVLPRSRTFIRSRVEDNPYLMESGYDRLLDNLPDGIREKLRYGDFGFQMDDGPQQLIPTGWIEAAQQRYKDGNYNQDVSVRTIGCDPARGGKDRTVIAIREGDRVDYFSQPGKATPDGSAVVQQILKYWTPNTPINLDVIGIGSSVIDYLKDLGYPVTPVNFAKGSFKRDRSGLLKFRNLRTEVFWNLRDLLDPHWGHTIALPPDTAVLNELTSLTYKLTHGGVMVDSKDAIRAKLRMSCDIADAIALACYRGMSYISAF